MSLAKFEQSFTGRTETRNLVREVLEACNESVIASMGPDGEVTLILKSGKTIVTRDGVSIAKALDFNDTRRNMIAEVITSAAIRTDELVGDGTTTTVFMVYKLYNEFGNSMNFNTSMIIDELVEIAGKHISSLVTEVSVHSEEFKRMIYTTSNYEKDISDTVIGIFKRFNSPNVTLVEAAGEPNDIIDTESMIAFDGSYGTPALTTAHPSGLVNDPNVAVMIIDNNVDKFDDERIIQIGNEIISKHRRILIIARSFDQGILNKLIGLNMGLVNKLGPNENVPYVIPFRLNAGGTIGTNIFKDLSKLLGITFFNEVPGETAIDELFKITTTPFTIAKTGIKFDGNHPVIKERSDEILSSLMPQFEEMTISERANVLGKALSSRIGRLLAENVILRVSGLTSAEITERKYLFEDAIRVAKTSTQFGVIPGIGYGYNSAAQLINDSIVEPLKSIPKEELTDSDAVRLDIATRFCNVLTSQYSYLTGNVYDYNGSNYYTDLVLKNKTLKPECVFDNGCAAVSALQAGWSVTKRLGKLSTIIGKVSSGPRIG